MNDKNISWIKRLQENEEKKLSDMREYFRSVRRDISRRSTREKADIVFDRLTGSLIETVKFYMTGIYDVYKNIDVMSNRIYDLESQVKELKGEEKKVEKGVLEEVDLCDEVGDTPQRNVYVLSRVEVRDKFIALLRPTTGSAVTYSYMDIDRGNSQEELGICITFSHLDKPDKAVSNVASDAIIKSAIGYSKYSVDFNTGTVIERWRKSVVDNIRDFEVALTMCVETAMDVFDKRKHIGYRCSNIVYRDVHVYFNKGFWQEFFLSLGMDLNLDY